MSEQVNLLPAKESEFVLSDMDRRQIEKLRERELTVPLIDTDLVAFFPRAYIKKPTVARRRQGFTPSRPYWWIFVPGDMINEGSFSASPFGIAVAYSYTLETDSEREFLLLKNNDVWRPVLSDKDEEEFNARLNLFLIAYQQVV